MSDQLVIPLAPQKGVCHRDGAKRAQWDPPGKDLVQTEPSSGLSG